MVLYTEFYIFESYCLLSLVLVSILCAEYYVHCPLSAFHLLKRNWKNYVRCPWMCGWTLTTLM